MTRDRFLSYLGQQGIVNSTPTQYDGQPGIRAALVNWMTEEHDIQLALESMLACRAKID